MGFEEEIRQVGAVWPFKGASLSCAAIGPSFD